MLRDSFRGSLVGDNAYWPKDKKRAALAEHGITVTAEVRSNGTVKPTTEEKRLLKQRSKIERFIGLFNQQFHAERILNRSQRHYEARRGTKVVAHNAGRLLNNRLDLTTEAYPHFHLAA